MRKYVESVGAGPILNLQPAQQDLLEALNTLLARNTTFENDPTLFFEWAAPLHRYWTEAFISSGLFVRQGGRICPRRDNILALITELRQE